MIALAWSFRDEDNILDPIYEKHIYIFIFLSDRRTFLSKMKNIEKKYIFSLQTKTDVFKYSLPNLYCVYGAALTLYTIHSSGKYHYIQRVYI